MSRCYIKDIPRFTHSVSELYSNMSLHITSLHLLHLCVKASRSKAFIKKKKKKETATHTNTKRGTHTHIDEFQSDHVHMISGTNKNSERCFPQNDRVQYKNTQRRCNKSETYSIFSALSSKYKTYIHTYKTPFSHSKTQVLREFYLSLWKSWNDWSIIQLVYPQKNNWKQYIYILKINILRCLNLLNIWNKQNIFRYWTGYVVDQIINQLFEIFSRRICNENNNLSLVLN